MIGIFHFRKSNISISEKFKGTSVLEGLTNNPHISSEKALRLKKIFEEYLKKLGLRQTKQREQILDIVFTLSRHFDAEMVSNEIKKRKLAIGVATIYRTLNMMLDANILQEHNFLNSRACFEFAEENSKHDHIICQTCSEILEFSDNVLKERTLEITKQMGFKLKNQKLEIWVECMNKNCFRLKKKH